MEITQPAAGVSAEADASRAQAQATVARWVLQR